MLYAFQAFFLTRSQPALGGMGFFWEAGWGGMGKKFG